MAVLSIEDIQKAAIPIFKKYGIDEVYLFGFYARGEATDDSDVDFYYIKKQKMSLTRFIALREELERALGKQVDVLSNLALSLNMDKPDTEALLDSILHDRKELAYAS